MTIYEVPNIENCTVEAVGDPVAGYRVISNSGWYLHVTESALSVNIYKTFMALGINFDFSRLQVVAEADLPEGAEIHGVNNTETI